MAHRAVLACCSPYLFEIFNSDNEPHGVSLVTFEDLDPEAVEILLNYAYTAQWVAPLCLWYQDGLWSFFFSTELANLLCCRLKADKELVKEVYSAAKRFKMDRVKQACLTLLTLRLAQVYFHITSADLHNLLILRFVATTCYLKWIPRTPSLSVILPAQWEMLDFWTRWTPSFRIIY